MLDHTLKEFKMMVPYEQWKGHFKKELIYGLFDEFGIQNTIFIREGLRIALKTDGFFESDQPPDNSLFNDIAISDQDQDLLKNLISNCGQFSNTDTENSEFDLSLYVLFMIYFYFFLFHSLLLNALFSLHMEKEIK